MFHYYLACLANTLAVIGSSNSIVSQKNIWQEYIDTHMPATKNIKCMFEGQKNETKILSYVILQTIKN